MPIQCHVLAHIEAIKDVGKFRCSQFAKNFLDSVIKEIEDEAVQ